MSKIHNFSAGPCILPQVVFDKMAEACINFNNSGTSILEMKAFIYSPSQCNLGTHIDPDKLVCVSDVHTEIIANASRLQLNNFLEDYLF